MKKIVKGNDILVALIERLQKDKKPIWKSVAKELAKPRRNRVEVNISKLDSYAKGGATLLVPGKVLGSGEFTKKATVAAFSFSGSAKQLITAAGGKTISLDELYKSNPTGTGVVIVT